MFRTSLCAFLAPAVVSAMAFPWAGPEPTLTMPEADGWSPAPTMAPEANIMEMFKRSAGDNTCGYINGISTSSLTCNDNAYVCATNTYYGVHGCCDPSSLAACSIPTTCIPSSLLAASCTDNSCSTNDYIAKCTDSAAPYCYQWRYVYSTATVMTEFGCAASAFTISVQRTFNGENSAAATSSQAVIPISTAYVTLAPSSTAASSAGSSSSSSGGSIASQSQSGTSSPTPTPAEKSKTNVGAIVGGVVGGLVVIGAIIFGAIFMILRNRKNKTNQANVGAAQPPPMGPAPGVQEYKPQPPQQQYPPQQPYGQQPQAAPAGYYQPQQSQDVKPGYGVQHQQLGTPGQEIGGMTQPYSPPMSPAPQYSAPMHQGPPAGVAEAGGTPIQNPQMQQHTQAQHNVYEAP
ncbi:hypothetical protein AOQ84DRAFT_355122 [Glonium stellatum]|uniref:Uncharacterized protein n=1 Tax=Glonium stellatum TaxID=574774 RepID=A0A8E2JRT7_9PEZI|nr:hypothetical protein AOQ84DRAFT_355122 [Glonium stellatum]